MLKRSRLVAAVAVAGTICALGAASAASAAPPPGWSGKIGPVPHAFTNGSPALTTVSFGNTSDTQTLVAWKGQGGAHIWYAASPTIGVKSSWSPRAEIPGAVGNSAPSIASYRDPNGRNAVLAVWRGNGGRIKYAQGETQFGQTITWTAVGTLPKSQWNVSSLSPAVFFPLHRYVAVVAFRGPHNHIRYIEGIPSHRGFKWSASTQVSTTVEASSGPAIAEVQTTTSKGQIFVFWKGLHTNQINYSTTTDPLAAGGKVAWTAATALTGSVSSAAPAASSVGPHGSGAMMLAYKVPHHAHVDFRTLSGGVWSSPAAVPSSQTVFGPALVRGELATTSATSAGNIFFHVFS
jgi:hypothetical protein